MHRDNSYATSTPAVDADQLYVLWLDGDKVTLAALTHDGDEVWRRQIGTLVEKHGFGTSPVVVGDIVCVANETEDAAHSCVVGVDRKSGEVRWSQSARHRQDRLSRRHFCGKRRTGESCWWPPAWDPA